MQAARELLQKRALELVEEHIDTINEARADGKYEFALEAQRWLIDHIADDEGTRLVDPSTDKVKVEEKMDAGPKIQIGIQLGGVPQTVLPTPASARLAITEVPDGDAITVSEKTTASDTD